MGNVTNFTDLQTNNFAREFKFLSELTNNFGIGIAVLPSIVSQLGGWCQAQYEKERKKLGLLSDSQTDSFDTSIQSLA
jgi:hypothetical protein